MRTVVYESELKEMLTRFMAGDSEAEEQLVNKLDSVARDLVEWQLSGRKFQAHVEDIVQNSILSAFVTLRKCRDDRDATVIVPECVTTWMREIAIRRANDFYRAWYRRNSFEVQLETLDVLSNHEARQTADHREIEAFVDSLRDRNLSDLARSIMAGLNWKETRDMLGVSERKMIHLRKLLEKKLRDWLGPGELKQEEEDRP